MKKASWIICGILILLIMVQFWMLTGIKSGDKRDNFLVLPHSVILDREYKKPNTVPSEQTVLAGLTADDVIRGLHYLIDSKQEPITASQANELLSCVKKMNLQKNDLLTLRNDRHALNEASMEEALELGRLLSQAQLEVILQHRRNTGLGAASDSKWKSLMDILSGKKQ